MTHPRGRKSKARAPIQVRPPQGFKSFRLVTELLERLPAAGAIRDKAGNRPLFFDQSALLMLTYFFNPIVDSLRGLRQIMGLDKVQRLCGVKPNQRTFEMLCLHLSGWTSAEELDRHLTQTLRQANRPQPPWQTPGRTVLGESRGEGWL